MVTSARGQSVFRLRGALTGTAAKSYGISSSPHDVRYDLQVPILADIEFNGRQRHVMMWANRNGFYYTLDRSNGEFLIGKPYAAQTWAQGFDPVTGRPIRARNGAHLRRHHGVTTHR